MLGTLADNPVIVLRRVDVLECSGVIDRHIDDGQKVRVNDGPGADGWVGSPQLLKH